MSVFARVPGLNPARLPDSGTALAPRLGVLRLTGGNTSGSELADDAGAILAGRFLAKEGFDDEAPHVVFEALPLLIVGDLLAVGKHRDESYREITIALTIAITVARSREKDTGEGKGCAEMG